MEGRTHANLIPAAAAAMTLLLEETPYKQHSNSAKGVSKDKKDIVYPKVIEPAFANLFYISLS